MSQPTQTRELEPLPFKVDPHMLEDLGLNLYSNLPRVLVEFVANAYDADASEASIVIDFDDVQRHRYAVRNRGATSNQPPLPLAGQSDAVPDDPQMEGILPDDVAITIQDNGHGMSLEEMKEKFLVAGRRRREKDGSHSPGNRLLMGRKGVGKLAGFGVARKIEVISKTDQASNAHRIVLDFDSIMHVTDTRSVKVPTFIVSPEEHNLGQKGTRIVLSRLVSESLRSREDTIRRSIGDHFALIDSDDFSVLFNGSPATPTERTFAYAWPEREQLSHSELVEKELEIEESGQTVRFRYRLRFVGDHAALKASERGVRIYAHKRLAAAPSLLQADTNMHGFRMVDYLDGVVHADFIDDQPRDYIATDRQGLRWETPLLNPVREFLSEEIKEACKNYQKIRDAAKENEVEEDDFTKQLIDSSELSQRERRLAIAICVRLAAHHRQGVAADDYREQAQLLVGAVGKGEIFGAIANIASQPSPGLHELATEVTKLTHAEIDQTLGVVRTRIKAIEALRRIVVTVDFKGGNNESELHQLLKKNPWLIDPTYFEFLSSDRATSTWIPRLEEKLEIGSSVPAEYDPTTPAETSPQGKNLRPDLVFLLGNQGLSRLVIVELKAPNTPLQNQHLSQLQDYMRIAEAYFESDRYVGSPPSVEGYLIGSFADDSSTAREVERLKYNIAKRDIGADWVVFDLQHLLDRTLLAHKEFLEIYDRLNVADSP